MWYYGNAKITCNEKGEDIYMTKKEFQQFIAKGKMILDGATGSNLQKRGMPTGVCPEEWTLEHPEVLVGLQREYIEAGSDVLYAPTFSGNRIKLEEYGLADQIGEMNRKLAGLSFEAIRQADTDRQVLVAGDITMTGQQLYPVGSLPFEELVDIYKEQTGYLVEAGVDFIVVETMMSLQECRAAVLAVKEVSEMPVMVTLTFAEDGRTLFGTNPETAALVMTAMGVDAIGVNCSTGPDKMVSVIGKMCRYTALPIVAKPNAGLPQLVDGETVYDMGPEIFAEEMCALAEAGADVLGGCCGTTPEHIEKLVRRLEEKGLRTDMKYPERKGKVVRRALSTERNVLPIELDGAFKVIGERINPTGKKALQAQLREGSLELVGEMAEAQVEAGAAILDVNMGTNGIDEKEMMWKVVNELTLLTDTPLSIDSSYVEVIEAALRIYPGRALINSISMEQEKMKRLLPIAKKYGAMFILLPLSDEGLPKDIQEKKDIIHTVLEAAAEYELTPEDVIVDGLVATIGANKMAAVETLETIRYCKHELGVATACGLSNISFGLPERAFVNSNFMAMAIMNGLTMAIANPSQDLLMHAVYASDLLMNKPDADLRYIERVNEHKLTMVSGEVDSQSLKTSVSSGTKASAAIPEDRQGDEIFEAVVKGKKQRAQKLVEQAVKGGKDPQQLIDESLIPGIIHVGELYEKQIYYLPQLISSAETMEASIDYLEPVLAEKRSGESLGTIVIATVEHDIHDIGKNLVGLMLKNYGYHVVDLGKDVPAETIIEAAIKEKADIIGLSALMTTTMMEMKKVVDMVHEQNLPCKVLIGGAVITQSFADEIGADGYSEDAQEAVAVVGRLLGRTE